MRTQQDLKILQALPIDIKIAKTKQRIFEYVMHFGVNNCYISFSGGKDSTVLLDIARQEFPELKAVFVNTGLEYPEIVQFVKTFDNVEIIRPDKSFKQVLTEYGYPLVNKGVARAVCYTKNYLNNNCKTKMTEDVKKLMGVEPYGKKKLFELQ